MDSVFRPAERASSEGKTLTKPRFHFPNPEIVPTSGFGFAWAIALGRRLTVAKTGRQCPGSVSESSRRSNRACAVNPPKKKNPARGRVPEPPGRSDSMLDAGPSTGSPTWLRTTRGRAWRLLRPATSRRRYSLSRSQPGFGSTTSGTATLPSRSMHVAAT